MGMPPWYPEGMAIATELSSIPLIRIDGTATSLDEFRGQVLLIVNVASKCGLTPQYEGLEKLYARYRNDGLQVLGFPANDFAGQEPGSNDEIATFCRSTFGTSFPMFSKLTATGPAKHPLYRELTAAQPASQGEGKHDFIQGLIRFGVQPNAEPEVLWNFEKFLISRSGEVVARFSPDTLPFSRVLTDAIKAELARR